LILEFILGLLPGIILKFIGFRFKVIHCLIRHALGLLHGFIYAGFGLGHDFLNLLLGLIYNFGPLGQH
jgi:hypothetical protein